MSAMRKEVLSSEDAELRALRHLADFGCAGADLVAVVYSYEREKHEALPTSIIATLERLVTRGDAEMTNGGFAYRTTLQGSARLNGDPPAGGGL